MTDDNPIKSISLEELAEKGISLTKDVDFHYGTREIHDHQGPQSTLPTPPTDLLATIDIPNLGLFSGVPGRTGNRMMTASGNQFWPTNPRADEVRIEDIAHALSQQCRWSGHTRCFYSVAQHCLLVSFTCDPADALWGLLHDAAETYISDLPRPIKKDPSMAIYLVIERRVELAICNHFGLYPQMPESVKRADEIVLATEARDLMGDPKDLYLPYPPLVEPILAMSPGIAYQRFMARFAFLTTQTGPSHRKSETKEYPK